MNMEWQYRLLQHLVRVAVQAVVELLEGVQAVAEHFSKSTVAVHAVVVEHVPEDSNQKHMGTM